MRHRAFPYTLAWLSLAALAFTQTAAGQYPGQYPPNTYPPGQYPPNTYPPGQYPPGGGYPPNTYPPNNYPNTYPTRLPGGVPVNLPVPEVKLPKKGSKDKEPKGADSDLKLTVATVDGALRKLGEKDLVLQAGPKKLLRFRLLAKTKFLNKEGEPVRDSLLHAGDQLTITVNADDEETALKVVLTRSGTSSERAAADLPFDNSTVRAPRAEDLGKARTVAREESATTVDASTETAEPTKSAADADPTVERLPASGSEPAGAAGGSSDEQLILHARASASSFSSTLPSYLVQQLTTRYFSSGFPAHWQKLDEVTADLSYVDGREQYRNIAINGSPSNAPPERSGSWSTGEFGTTLEDIMSPITDAKFKRRMADDRIAGRPCAVFDYTVLQGNSHWEIVSPDDRHVKPAYSGAVWIDKESHRVLRIEQTTTSLPNDFPFSRAESILEYGFAKIDAKNFLLPMKAENLACSRGSGSCSRNAIEFRNYRKFSTDSTITFGKFAAAR